LAAVDEDPAVRGQRCSDALDHLPSCSRVATIERTHAYSEDDVEGQILRFQDKGLGGDVADTHPTGRDLRG
jgi:hypothetical protein